MFKDIMIATTYSIWNGIASLSSQFDALEQDVIKLIREELDRMKQVVSGEVYRDGLTNVLAEPEFAESESARKALRVWKSALCWKIYCLAPC
jgi:heat-inducible transcriptional repressor